MRGAWLSIVRRMYVHRPKATYSLVLFCLPGNVQLDFSQNKPLSPLVRRINESSHKLQPVCSLDALVVKGCPLLEWRVNRTPQ